MDPLLIDQWLEGAEAIEILDEASLSIVRDRVRERALAFGLPEKVMAGMVSVASELGRNQLVHARHGEIAVKGILRGGVAGLEIVAADRGDGVAAPADAILGPPPIDKASLGVGLAAVLELSDEVDFDVRIGEGTCIWARKFAEPLDKRRQLGIFGRPFPGERTSGDHACFVRHGDALLVAVVDGLGHGEPAREASNAAVAAARAHAERALDAVLHEVDGALAQTRGAVMALARFPDSTRVEIACAGNIGVHVEGPEISRRAAGPSVVLGGRNPIRKFVVETISMGPRDACVLFTDGLTTKTDAHDLDLLREHPIVIANRLVQKFGRDTDDALALVVR